MSHQQTKNTDTIKEIIFYYNTFNLNGFYFTIHVDFSMPYTYEYINFIYNKLRPFGKDHIPLDHIILLYFSMYSNNYKIISNIKKLEYMEQLLDIKLYEDNKFDLTNYTNFEKLYEEDFIDKNIRMILDERFFNSYEFEQFDPNNTVNFNRIVNDRIIIELQTENCLDENTIIDNDFDNIAFLIANPDVFTVLHQASVGDITTIANILNISTTDLQRVIENNKTVRGARFRSMNILKTIFPRQMLENTYQKDKYILEYIHKFFEEITDEEYDDERAFNENGGVLSIVFFNGSWDGEEVLDGETTEKYQQLQDKLKEDFEKKDKNNPENSVNQQTK